MVKVKTKGVAVSFEPVPEGLYTLQVENAEKRDSANGKPAYRLTCLILAPEEVEGRKVQGLKLFDNGSLQQHALFGIKRACLALGVEADVLEDEDGWDTDEVFPEIIGREADAYVKLVDRTDRPGQKSNNIEWVLPEADGTPSW